VEIVEPMQLRLRPKAKGALTSISLVGVFPSEMPEQRRRALFELLTLLGQGPVHVVLSVAARAGAGWIDPWVAALGEADAPLTVEFRPAAGRTRTGR
jgi:hypothetical protein